MEREAGTQTQQSALADVAVATDAGQDAAPTVRAILELQRRAGNAAVVELLSVAPPPGPAIQRDLAAFGEPHVKRLGMATLQHSADAPAIRAALAALVSARKVRRSYDGDYSLFSSTGASKAEVETALAAARYPKATEMADVLVDQRNVRLYSNERLVRVDRMWGGAETVRTDKEQLETPQARPLTMYERGEANKVFAGALQLDGVRISVGGPMTVGGYARTVPDHIYFPDGNFTVSLLIHELTHVWQYQEDVAAADVIQDALFASYDYGGPMYLMEAWASGESFSHFNHEQQGDILEHYYDKLGNNPAELTPYQHFVDQVRSGTWRGPRNLERERREREAREREANRPPPPAPGPIGPSVFDHLGDMATEVAIIGQLQRRIRSEDIPALAARKRTLLELFGRFAPDVAAATLTRIRTPRPNDVMVRLLERRVSRQTRAEVVTVLSRAAPSR